MVDTFEPTGFLVSLIHYEKPLPHTLQYIVALILYFCLFCAVPGRKA